MFMSVDKDLQISQVASELEDITAAVMEHLHIPMVELHILQALAVVEPIYV